MNWIVKHVGTEKSLAEELRAANINENAEIWNELLELEAELFNIWKSKKKSR